MTKGLVTVNITGPDYLSRSSNSYIRSNTQRRRKKEKSFNKPLLVYNIGLFSDPSEDTMLIRCDIKTRIMKLNNLPPVI